MKKLFCLTVLLVSANMIFAQGGRIRVTFAGFDCYRETWDDILNTDGKGDEVFFNFSCVLGDKSGNTKLNYEKRTAVYGDASNPFFSNRISAGSWTDAFGNNKGGIKAGDTYRTNVLIGEYDMADGDILTVIPTGWEHDPISDNLAGFSSTLRNSYASITQKAAPYINTYHAITANWVWLIINAVNFDISKTKPAGDQGELGKAGTRPIGMEKYGDFSPKLVLLSTGHLPLICNSDFGFGKGVIAVNYDEVALGNTRDHGNYTILLKIEYFPAAASATTNTSTNTNTSTTNNTTTKSGVKTLPLNFNNNTATSITGIWKGTWGNGANNGPSYYGFQLNADGTMRVLDANGNNIATGKYTFSNNQLTGSYEYYSNKAMFSFSATLTGSQLNGSWGAGSNASSGGKWVLNKTGTSATSNIR
jgi:hypothetical protein